ncbi:ABC transporter ATP-binding protein [Streptomyces sp. BP-8]|uniref:ABC transporter ATP-binding protein n=1 Tax=Streptomyces sirii TaxID=3127701 RepID=A0ABZ2QWB2_9ACTN
MPTGPEYQRLRILRELVRGRKALLTVVVLLSIISTVCNLAMPLIVARLIGAVQAHTPVLWPVVWMTASALGAAVSAAASGYLLARGGERMVHGLRTRIMGHVLRLPLHQVRTHGTGNLVTRVTADSAQLRSIVDLGILQLPISGLTTVATIVIMGYLDWVLLLATLAGFSVAGLIIGVVIKGLRRSYAAHQSALGVLAHRFTTALDALPTVKAYRAETAMTERLAEASETTSVAALRSNLLNSALNPAMGLGQQIALVAVIAAGGARYASGVLSVADFAAFLLYLMQLVAPVFVIAIGLGQLQAGLSARKRFDEVLSLSTEESADPAASPTAVSSPSGPAVRFEGVDFAYDDQSVLRGATFTVPSRGLTAVVGESGTGKSTALALIERFVTPAGGRVKVLGRDTTDWTLSGLRARITYVDQAFTLLTDTLRANLTVGHRVAPSDEALFAVLETVGLSEAVQNLPQGIDTVIGEAVDLSGGQRQRVALARALLADTEIVLFDEPTSQLDSINERSLRTVVERLAAERAVVMVTHRMSVAGHADHVVFMHGGQVPAEGTHQELLDGCPPYQALVAGERPSLTANSAVPAGQA